MAGGHRYIFYLLLRDVDGLVEDYPGDRLVAAGHGRGAIVGDVGRRVGQQSMDGQARHRH